MPCRHCLRKGRQCQPERDRGPVPAGRLPRHGASCGSEFQVRARSVTGSGGETANKTLLPYVPRLTLNWAAAAPNDRTQAVEGSLLFVDISGFTKMSERLARHGKVGAEEVTDAIGTCFEALLEIAYQAGGGLLKFGGDALLLLFTGPDHA